MLPEGILSISRAEPTFKALEQTAWGWAGAATRKWLAEAQEQLDAPADARAGGGAAPSGAEAADAGETGGGGRGATAA